MKKLITFTLSILIFWSCSKDDENPKPVGCGFEVAIDAQEYANAPSDQLTINGLEINNNCLKINFGSGGCSGDSWELKLIDSKAILESSPPQRNLRLSLKNEELCQAYIIKELTFDISIAVLSAVYDKPYKIPAFTTFNVTSEDLDKYLGVYSSKQIALKITITKDGNTLIAQGTGQPAFPLEATDKDKFKFDQAGAKFEFNPTGKKMILFQGGGQIEFTKE